MKKFFVTATISLLALAFNAQAERYGDLDIIAKTFLPPSTQYYHGYCEVTFQITNNSQKNAHEVNVEFPGEISGNSTFATRTVKVGPDSTVNCVIYMPQDDYYDFRTKIKIDGSLQKEMLPVAMTPGGYRGGNNKYILRSRNVPSAVADSFQPKSSSIGGPDINVPRSECDIQNWSENFLAYTPCDAVIITDKDWALMKPGAKEALRRYVSAGGILAISGLDVVPDELTMPGDESSENGRDLGFGRCFVFTGDDALAKNREFRRALDSQENLQHSESTESLVGRFPIVDMNRLPVKGMLIMLVMFSILIGPVLMIILSKYRKRIWMFWLVPLISLVACLALFIFSVVSEGFTPTVRTSSVTMLDENTNQAVTLGFYGIYAPLTPGNGLNFSDTTEVRDVTSESSEQRKLINWSKEQQLENGWVSARVPTYFNVRQCQTRRERVNVKFRGDTAVAIVNGLGADIKTIKYCDASGNIYIAQNVPAGKEAPLAKSGTSASMKTRRTLGGDLRYAYSSTVWDFAPGAITSLAPETYHATLTSDPFMPTGVSKPILKQNCIVIGICRRTGNAD